jgi:cytochrome c biogenesis protein ResB
MTPEKEEAMKELAGEIGGLVGKLIGSLIFNAIFASLLYVILIHLVGVSVTYLQVFGMVLILDFIKSYTRKV